MLSEKTADTQDVTEDVPTEQTPAPEARVEPELLETIPIEEREPGQLLESCPACGTLMDVTEQPPFAKIFCPSCGQNLRTRRQFNHYRLSEHIGEGGMGSVFKSEDCNLHRNVALKILKRECSANAEEQAKLETEARITASINHPNVVKVFSFGQDHGQFYLAMELVEQGSLDQLMSLQQRVPEMQVLTVGIQIAEGLEAGLEKGLIHRDIKPGNILFSDAHTAKLVDFGLAVVMDDAAKVTGEIWGTPYYIAPEKLDNQVEDFRSDIYSLGGTLFHALAGRPPYEAETASMVALKQLKSQPVSLQSFAPHVSSETAYVINRMLAKDREDRYGSYRELIEHLNYARNKLLERTQKPIQPKARVVMETQETRNFAAYVTLGLLAIVLIVGTLVFVFRDQIFKGAESIGMATSSSATYSAEESSEMLLQGAKLMANRQYEEAASEFNRIAKQNGVNATTKNWAWMNQGAALLAQGDRQKAASFFQVVERAASAPGVEQTAQNTFFLNASKELSSPSKLISPDLRNSYSSQTSASFALFCFALHNWEIGRFADAAKLLDTFIRSNVGGPDAWIMEYKPLARIYLTDAQVLAGIEAKLSKATTPALASALLGEVKAAQAKVTTGNKITERLTSIEKVLTSRGGKA